MASSEPTSPFPAAESEAASTQPSVRLAARVLIVRLRFFLVLGMALLLVGSWPILRHYGQRLIGQDPATPRGMTSDMEFWCPMCPGVVSDFPGKCPVCNMALVRRKKGEATPLPDGVLARMQLSPYRVQLAGIRTSVVEYRPLRRPIILVGLVERSSTSSEVEVQAEAFPADLPFLTEGQFVEADSEALPGHAPFRGKILRIDREERSIRPTVTVRLVLDNPDRDLRPGMLVTAHTDALLVRLPWWRRAMIEEAHEENAASTALCMLLAPAIPHFPNLFTLLRQAGRHALLALGHGLAVPCSAVIDHGSRKVVFVESGPGMFDAVEITIGPRCGDYYAVRKGLDAGQRVAATGAFLLDAEMNLNHNLAAAYFGAARDTTTLAPAAPAPTPPSSTAEEERSLIAKQKICPVTGEPLDSMGGPVRVEVDGRIVFVCCKGCIAPLRREPAKYLSKLPPQLNKRQP